MLKLANIFSDHAVLQRQMPVIVWGQSTPFDVIAISIDDTTVACLANNLGAFQAALPPHEAGGPYTMTVKGQKETITISDILYGEVWLAGGQSNMEMPLTGFNVPLMSQQELDALEFPENFRLLYINKLALTHVVGDINNHWLMANQPENYSLMSADASFFAKKLGKELGNIPIGIISSNWGGTFAEAWISREALRKLPDFVEDVDQYDRKISAPDYLAFDLDYSDPNSIVPVDAIDWMELQDYFNKHEDVDPSREPDNGLYKIDFDDSSWAEGELPRKNWNLSHGITTLGVVWYRKEVQLPAAWEGHDIQLNIGAVDKQDVTYFNGVQVGATGAHFETNWWCIPRNYKVPGNLVKEGKAVIAVRAYSFLFDGGMNGPAAAMKITCPEVDRQCISLAGTWKAYQSIDFGSIPVAWLTAPAPTATANGQTSNCGLANSGINHANSYHILFDSMIAPLIPYAIRGVLWYQGCSNECFAQYYEPLMTALINDWRNRWNQPEFAFIQTLLAGFDKSAYNTWPEIRAAQMNSAHATGTDFVSAMDLGDPEDIHPLRKRALGERSADVALASVYGKDIEAYGPQPAGIVRRENDIILLLDHAHGLHTNNNEAPSGFELLMANGEIRTATPTIQKNSLVFANVPENATAIRYAWNNYPITANCYNDANLPMIPFVQDL